MSRRKTLARGPRRAPRQRSAEEAWDEVIHLLALDDAENGEANDTEEDRQWAQRLAAQVRAQVAERLLREPAAALPKAPPALTPGSEALVPSPDDELRGVGLKPVTPRIPTN